MIIVPSQRPHKVSTMVPINHLQKVSDRGFFQIVRTSELLMPLVPRMPNRPSTTYSSGTGGVLSGFSSPSSNGCGVSHVVDGRGAWVAWSLLTFHSSPFTSMM